MKKVLSFISSASQSRTTAVLGLLIILAAIPLTVMVAQKQQELRQHAAGLGESCTSNFGCDTGTSCIDGLCQSSGNFGPTTTTIPFEVGNTQHCGIYSPCVWIIDPKTGTTYIIPNRTDPNITGPVAAFFCPAGGNCTSMGVYQSGVYTPNPTFPTTPTAQPTPTTSNPTTGETTCTDSANQAKMTCAAQQGITCKCTNNVNGTENFDCNDAVASLRGTSACVSKLAAVYVCGSVPPNPAIANAIATSICQATPTQTPTPTATPTPPLPGINFSIGLDGIGSVGDSVNPNVTANPTGAPSPFKNPSKQTIQAFIHIADNKVDVAPKISTTLTYDTSFGGGKYKGTTSTPSSVTGAHDIRIEVPGHLIKSAGIQTLSAGQTISISANLIAGDVNGDNVIDGQDYNILISCFSNKTCDAANKTLSDLNSDGVVDGVDYNLLLREWSVGRQGVTRPGD